MPLTISLPSPPPRSRCHGSGHHGRYLLPGIEAKYPQSGGRDRFTYFDRFLETAQILIDYLIGILAEKFRYCLAAFSGGLFVFEVDSNLGGLAIAYPLEEDHAAVFDFGAFERPA